MGKWIGSYGLGKLELFLDLFLVVLGGNSTGMDRGYLNPNLADFSSLWFKQTWTLKLAFYLLIARWLKWLEREFTDRKVCGSNPTSASRLPLSRLGRPDSIPALVVPSGCMAVRHRKGFTAERMGCPPPTQHAHLHWCENDITEIDGRLPLLRLGQLVIIPALVIPSGGLAARHRNGVTAER
ncbi:hypothetical protein CSKR_100596 [Clonorchis sinensis]|uniref:Uncharacterized protein n=1 Tax=Clonorchis sinensis TaxID=79923 RepID=A0A419PG41_CLOSI|nr:hypothetical protein CSKR_100596 [Clonorchis sinensis]